MVCPPHPPGSEFAPANDEGWPSLNTHPHPELARVSHQSRFRFASKVIGATIGLAAWIGNCNLWAQDNDDGTPLAEIFDREGERVRGDCAKLTTPKPIGLARTHEVNFDTMQPGKEVSLYQPISVGEEANLYMALAIPPDQHPQFEVRWELNGKPSPGRTVHTAPKWALDPAGGCDMRLALPVTFTYPHDATWTFILSDGTEELFRQDLSVVMKK